MLGSRFSRYAKPMPPRHFSRLDLFARFLNHRVKDATMRASHITPNGYGSRLLVEIIKLADLNVILSTGDLPSYLLPILKDLEKPIDPRNGRHTTKSLFIKSGSPCFELISPSRLPNPFITIPWDKPYEDPTWSEIRPLRMVDLGTADLHFSAHSGYLTYTTRGPTHAVYTLDCLSLIGKFVAYYKSRTMVDNVDQVILDFLHTEIITPMLLNDSASIWLRNLYKQQLLTGSPLEFHTSTMWDVVTSDVIGPDVTGAVADIIHIKRDLINQTINPQTALSSLPGSPSGDSLATYFTRLYDTTQSPDGKPFLWVDCLKYLNWWELILLTASYSSDTPATISLKRDVLRDVRLMVMIKPWQEIYNSYPFKTIVRAKIDGLNSYLKSY